MRNVHVIIENQSSHGLPDYFFWHYLVCFDTVGLGYWATRVEYDETQFNRVNFIYDRSRSQITAFWNWSSGR